MAARRDFASLIEPRERAVQGEVLDEAGEGFADFHHDRGGRDQVNFTEEISLWKVLS